MIRPRGLIGIDVSLRSQVTRNAASSVGQVVVSGVTLFLLYRFLLAAIGAQQLGLWSLVLAATSASRISELGFSASVVKFVAQLLARREHDRAAVTIETALLASGAAVAVVALAMAPALVWALPRIVESTAVPEALELLPWALLSLWLGVLAAVVQGALDGCQRADLRGVVVSGGNVLFLIAAVVLVRTWGLRGLAYAQACQGAATGLAAWILLRRQLPALSRAPHRFDRTMFRALLKYGASFQAISVVNLLFDPITKVLMSKFGSLGLVGYYEMANRMITQLRNVLVASNQVLVPVFASLNEHSRDAMKTMYLDSYRLMFYLGIPYFSLICSAIPLISWAWIGRYEPAFVQSAELLTIGWGVNTLIVPAYFANMGTGDLRWNTVSHAVTSIVNGAAGYSLGIMIGGLAVVAGASLSLVVGSAVVPLAFHRAHAIAAIELLPIESRSVMMTSVALATVTSILAAGLGPWPSSARLAGFSLLAFVVALAVPVWRHPLRARLLRILQDSRGASPDGA